MGSRFFLQYYIPCIIILRSSNLGEVSRVPCISFSYYCCRCVCPVPLETTGLIFGKSATRVTNAICLQCNVLNCTASPGVGASRVFTWRLVGSPVCTIRRLAGFGDEAFIGRERAKATQTLPRAISVIPTRLAPSSVSTKLCVYVLDT